MNPSWIAVVLLSLTLLTLPFLWIACRREYWLLSKEYEDHRAARHQRSQADAEWFERVQAQVDAVLAQTAVEQKDTLWTGAFLPTDAAAAAMETAIRQSEDHAISAAGPIRFSSRPSKGSASGSAREPSTQQARRSGRL